MLFLQRSVEVASWFISKEWGKKGGPRFVSPSVGKQSGKLLLFLLFNSRSCFEGAEKREKWRDGLEFEERDFFFFFFLILIYEIINRGSKNITNIVDLRSSLIQSLVILTRVC